MEENEVNAFVVDGANKSLIDIDVSSEVAMSFLDRMRIVRANLGLIDIDEEKAEWDEKKQRDKEEIAGVMLKRKILVDGRGSFVDMNRKQNAKFDVARRSGIWHTMSKANLQAAWNIRGLPRVGDYYRVIEESGEELDSWLTRPEIVARIGEFSPQDLKRAITRLKDMTEVGFDRRIFSSQEGMGFLRIIADVEEDSYERIMKELSGYHFVTCARVLGDDDLSLSADANLLVELFENDGLSENQKKAMDAYEETMLNTGNYDDLSRGENDDMVWANENGKITRTVVRGRQSMSQVIAGYPGDGFLDNVRRYMEWVYSMTREYRDNPDQLAFFGSRTFAGLVNWGAEENFLRVVEDGYFGKQVWEMVGRDPNVLWDSRAISIYSQAKEILDDPEKYAWLRIVEELGAEKLVSLSGNPKGYEERVMDDRVELIRYLQMISSVPQASEFRALKNIFVNYLDEDQDKERKIAPNYRAIQQYLDINLRKLRDRRGDTIGAASAEDEDEAFYTMLAGIHRTIFIDDKNDKLDDSKWILLDKLIGMKGRIGDIGKSGESAGWTFRFNPEFSLTIMQDPRISDEVIDAIFRSHLSLDPEGFFQVYKRLAADKLCIYVANHPDIVNSEFVPEKERLFWNILNEMVVDKKLDGQQALVTQLTLVVREGIDEYFDGEEVKWDLIEKMADESSDYSVVWNFLHTLKKFNGRFAGDEHSRLARHYLQSAANADTDDLFQGAYWFWKRNKHDFASMFDEAGFLYEINQSYIDNLAEGYREGEVDADWVARNLGVLLTSRAMENLAPEQREYWEFVMSVPFYSRVRMLEASFGAEIDEIDLSLYRNPETKLPTPTMVRLIAEGGGGFDDLREFSSKEGFMESLPLRDRAFLQAIYDMAGDDPSLLIIAKSNKLLQTYNPDIFVDERGRLTQGFFEYVLSQDTPYPFHGLLSDEVIDNFEEEKDRVFWSYVRGETNFRMIKMLAEPEIRGRITEIIDGGGRIKREFVEVLSSSLGEVSWENARAFQDFRSGLMGTLARYIESAKDEGDIDINIVDSLLEYRPVTPDHSFELISRLIALDPDWSLTYARLKEESSRSEWADTIPNPEMFWMDNSVYLIYLRMIGIRPEKLRFSRFRSIVNNEDISSILLPLNSAHSDNYDMLPFDYLRMLQENIGLSLDNWYYVSSESMRTMREKLSDLGDNAKFYKRVLAQQPRNFNNLISALAANVGKIDLNDRSAQEAIIEAMQKIGSVTPLILRSYVMEKDPGKRAQFAEAVNEFRVKVHGNEPVKDMFDGSEGVDLLTEMITTTFPGTSVDVVKAEIGKVEDRCEDLKDLVIKKNGYIPQISKRARKVVLKDGQVVDRQLLDNLREVFPRKLSAKDKERYERELRESLERFISRAGAISNIRAVKLDGRVAEQIRSGKIDFDLLIASPDQRGLLDELRFILEPRQLMPSSKAGTLTEDPDGAVDKLGYDLWADASAMLSILYEDEVVVGFRKTEFDEQDSESVSSFLSRAGELIGVYFKDNFENRLRELMEVDGELCTSLGRRLKSIKKLRQLRQNFEKQLSYDESLVLSKDLEKIEELVGTDDEVPVDIVARVIRTMIEQRFLSGSKNNPGFRGQIRKEQNKFEFEEVEVGDRSRGAVKFSGHVSKNFASYFAKTTAGLCTSADYQLFTRPEHFHINLVNTDNICVGNVQGYIIDYNGRRSLLFRGFNPSSSVVDVSNSDLWVEGIVDIISQLVDDNPGINLSDVYITGQEAGWHALTNRASQGVYDSVRKLGVLKEENKVAFDYSIASSHDINFMYPLFPEEKD